jgi:2-polyprenyl-3-methyl-5-hydroxy-6-metoxy-1,4-benzoquinol methylase
MAELTRRNKSRDHKRRSDAGKLGGEPSARHPPYRRERRVSEVATGPGGRAVHCGRMLRTVSAGVADRLLLYGRRVAQSLDERDSTQTAALGETWLPEEVERVERCPVCGSGDRQTLYDGLQDRFFGTRGRWTLRCCLQCGAGYLDPRPSAATIGRAYECYFTHDDPPTVRTAPLVRLRHALRNGYVNATLGYRLRPAVPFAPLLVAPLPTRRRRAQRLVRNLPHTEHGRLLDIGCGRGGLMSTMSAAGWHVEGVEPDGQAAHFVRTQGFIVHERPFEAAELPLASFDAITMDNVLEHLAEPVQALRRCRELLAPEGLLWMATPNFSSTGLSTYGIDWVGLEAPRHLVLWTPESLVRALRSAGFDVVFLAPLEAGWMLRESARLQIQRLGLPFGRTRRWRLAFEGALRDLRARRDPRQGEELVVLAKARAG